MRFGCACCVCLSLVSCVYAVTTFILTYLCASAHTSIVSVLCYEQEREESIREISSAILDINALYKELGMQVEMQGQMIGMRDVVHLLVVVCVRACVRAFVRACVCQSLCVSSYRIRVSCLHLRR